MYFGAIFLAGYYTGTTHFYKSVNGIWNNAFISFCGTKMLYSYVYFSFRLDKRSGQNMNRAKLKNA